ncbi:hypothetical protein BKA82DRAFT_3966815, partial [Pisolithus tinctorius]
AFTDYRTQAQTIKYCIVDIGSPPTGKIMLFNAYIALSCGRGRHLSNEDQQLENMDCATEAWWDHIDSNEDTYQRGAISPLTV